MQTICHEKQIIAFKVVLLTVCSRTIINSLNGAISVSETRQFYNKELKFML